MLSFFIISTHALLMAAVILRVLLRRPARGVALAWLLMAVMLPYFGALLYFLIGERRIPCSRAERIARLQGDFRRITAPHVAKNRLLRGSVQLTPEQRPALVRGDCGFGNEPFYRPSGRF